MSMRPLGSLIVAIVFLLAALNGCSGGAGRGGSSGFDASTENAAIHTALETGQCVDFKSLQYCPAEARASVNTPTAAPRVNTDLATVTSVDCFQAVPGGPCTYAVRFVAQGFDPGTTFQALSRVDAADNPWVLGPDPRVGGSDPTNFSTTLVLTAADGGPPAQVQFAILAFAGPPPSSTEVGQLHEAEATYAFMTQELTVNVLTPPTSTPTPTLTPLATPTPGPNDCCQCESSCEAPVDGSCGTCTVVFGSVCGPEFSCLPRPTPTATPVPCVDCTHVYVSNSEGGTVSVIDTSTNLVTATVAVGSEPTGLAANPTYPFVYVGGRSGVVSLVGTLTNTVFQEIEVGRQPFAIGFTPDGAFAYVTDLGLNTVSILVSGGGGQFLLPVGTQPVAVAATPDGRFVYVVNTCGDSQCFPIARGTVSIIDTQIRLPTNTLPLGYRSSSIAMNPTGRFAYVANQCGEDPECASEGTLSVIDIGTQTVVDDIHITGQFGSQYVAVTPDGRFAYVANACGTSHPGCSDSDGSVSVVDLLTNSLVGPDIPVVGQPSAIAITPDGRTAYVTAGSSDRVVAIDTATNAVDATIPVGRHPLFLAIAVATPPPTLTPIPTPSVTPTRTPPGPWPTPQPTTTPQPTASSGVVGTGTADTCTGAALNAALARFPLVTFDCGGPATIQLSGTTTIAADTTIDGGNLITIDGGSNSPVFQVAAGVEVTVQNLLVAHAIGDVTAAAPGGSSDGTAAFSLPLPPRGAIENEGTLTVTHSTFTGLGGAIYNHRGGTLTVPDSTFSAGTITNEGTLTVAGSTFSANSIIANFIGGTVTVTRSTFSGNGGISNSNGPAYFNEPFQGVPVGTVTVTDSTFTGDGITNSAILSVTNSTFSDNVGGAIKNVGPGIATVMNTTFSSNSAAGDWVGGAIFNSGGTLTVGGSTFAGNSVTAECFISRFGLPVCNGGWGGAIFNSGGTLIVANSTFAGNRATRACLNSVCGGGLGGAIYNAAGPGGLTVLNSTFVDNSASDAGAAIDNAMTCGTSGTDPCSATLANTIVASSSSGDSCAGPITDGGHNLDDGASCGFSMAKGSLSNTDPQLDPAGFQDNGGPTQTIALLPGSPAIDAGDDSICAAAPVNQLDQRGFTRPGAGHTHCSIGAYEFNGVQSEAPQ